MTFEGKRVAAALLAVAGGVAPVVAAPVISSVNKGEVARSGRVIVRGADLGALGGGHRVEVGGVPAFTARWSEGAVSVYVPEGAPLGPTTVRVIKADGSSAEFPIVVTDRSAAQGKVLWKFETDGGAVRHRGSVAADGTAYCSDNLGFLYAVGKNGDLRWVYCADCVNSTGAEGPVSLGPDGTVYAGGNPVGPDSNIHAVNPDGTRRWMYTDTWTDCIAGPSVGPDGNVYFVMENAGRGLTSVDGATGELLWASHPAGQAFIERGQYGADLAFGPSSSGGQVDTVYTAFDMRPQQTPVPQGADGSLFAYSTSGGARWRTSIGGQSVAGGQLQGEPAVGLDGTVYQCSLLPPNAWALYAHSPGNGSTKWSLYLPPGNVMTEPTVGASGTVYVVRNTAHLHAVRPSGTVAWTYSDGVGSMYEAPVESPDGRVVISSGSVGDTLSFSGHIRAVSGAGAPLWSVYLPREGDVPIVPRTRAFFSADSRRAYVGTSGGGPAGEEYAYLVALDTAPPCPADLGSAGGVTGGDGRLDNNDFIAFIDLFFRTDARADLGSAGGVSGGDGRFDNNDFIVFINRFFEGC